jgi:type I restriction enzyme M protein
VKTSILILDKSLAKAADTIAFFKVENDGFGLGAQRRAIEKNDLPQVQAELATYLHALRSKAPTDALALTTGLIVPKEKIAANGDYNLSGERYREGAVSSSSFPTVALGEVCELVRGVVFSKEDEVTEGGVQVLRANNINKDRYELDLDDIRRVSPKADFSDEKKLRKDDIFICLASGSKDHVGKVALINEDTDFYFGGFMGAIRVKPGRLHAGYLLKQLTTGHFNDFLREQIAGANINNLSGGLLYRFQIPLPPLEVQKEIVAEIEGYQKVINGARAVLDHYRPHISIHPDWPMVELEQVCEIEHGYAFKGEFFVEEGGEQFPILLTPGNFVHGGGLYFTAKNTKRYSGEVPDAFRLRRGDLVVVMTDLSPMMKILGMTAIIDSDDYLHNQRIGKVVLKSEDVLKTYLRYAFLIAGVNGHIKREATGSTVRHTSPTRILSVKIPLPPIATQQAIVAEIEAEQALVAANRELITRFEQKIQSTLARIWGEAAPACPEG